MAGLSNRKFLLVIVSSIAVLAIVAGAVVAVSATSRSENTEPGAAATTDCGFNYGDACVKTDEKCADCVDGAGDCVNTSDDGGGQTAPDACPTMDCGSVDNGICPKTGEECPNHIDGDAATDAVNGECPGNRAR